MVEGKKRETFQLAEVVRQRIRRLRAEKQLTQENLCSLAGISIDAVSRIESGNRTPSLDTLDKIAKAFGVRVVDLVDTGEMPRLRYPPSIQKIINTLISEPQEVQRATEKMVKAFVEAISGTAPYKARRAAETTDDYGRDKIRK